MSDRDILQQFYRDYDRIQVSFSTEQKFVCEQQLGSTIIDERPVSLKRKIIAWWIARVKQPPQPQQPQQQQHNEATVTLPESIFACFYWCTQASLADPYISFINQCGIFDSATHHLLDDGPHRILFRDDGLISIDKPFRESVIDGSDETVVQRWQLRIVAAPASPKPYSPHSLYWHQQPQQPEPTESGTHNALLIASFSVGVAIAAARMLRS